jgi:uncharacterized membrane protein
MVDFGGLFQIFRAFGRGHDPATQSCLWVFVAVAFSGAALICFTLATVVSRRTWWTGAVVFGAAAAGSWAMVFVANRSRPAVIHRPRRDIPPSGRA